LPPSDGDSTRQGASCPTVSANTWIHAGNFRPPDESGCFPGTVQATAKRHPMEAISSALDAPPRRIFATGRRIDKAHYRELPHSDLVVSRHPHLACELSHVDFRIARRPASDSAATAARSQDGSRSPIWRLIASASCRDGCAAWSARKEGLDRGPPRAVKRRTQRRCQRATRRP
jgi:hypothetical protein